MKQTSEFGLKGFLYLTDGFSLQFCISLNIHDIEHAEMLLFFSITDVD